MVKKRPKASCALAAAKRLAARADAENIHPQQAWIDSARTKPVALPARPRLVRVLRILGAAFERNLDDEAAARSTSLPPRRAMNRVEGDFVAIDAGNGHSLALRRDGSVACWGDNDDGQAPPEGVAGPF